MDERRTKFKIRDNGETVGIVSGDREAVLAWQREIRDTISDTYGTA